MDLAITWFVVVGGGGQKNPGITFASSPGSSCPLFLWVWHPPPLCIPCLLHQFFRGDFRQALGEHGPLAPAVLSILVPIHSGSGRASSTKIIYGHETLLIEAFPRCPRASARKWLGGGRQTSKFPLQFGTLSTGRDLHYWVASATCPPHRSFHAPRQSFPFPTTGERRLPLPGSLIRKTLPAWRR